VFAHRPTLKALAPLKRFLDLRQQLEGAPGYPYGFRMMSVDQGAWRPSAPDLIARAFREKDKGITVVYYALARCKSNLRWMARRWTIRGWASNANSSAWKRMNRGFGSCNNHGAASERRRASARAPAWPRETGPRCYWPSCHSV